MKAISLPIKVRRPLETGAALVLSISGGKDSQAMVAAVMHERQRQGWTGEVYAVHADLGRMEWPESKPHCEHIAGSFGIELVIVNRPQGDLVDTMQARMAKLAGQNKPHWPSAAARYCTSYHKRDQIDKVLRQHSLVVSAEGLRADESPARAKRNCVDVRDTITTRSRSAYTWRPILKWSTDDVWAAIGTSSKELTRRQALYRHGQQEEALAGWPAHPAYVYGNERVSCAMCVLASKNDIATGAKHNPTLLATLAQMEEQSGFTFTQKFALSTLKGPTD